MKLFLITLSILVFSLVVVHSVPVDDDEDDESAEDEELEDEEDQDDEEKEVKEKKKKKKGPPVVQSSPTSFYHNETEKSYEILTQGPCPNNLMFLKASKNPEEKYGDCACHQWALPGHPSYIPLVYHHLTQRCYPVYQQGYCKSITQWLVYTDPSRVECVPNKCLSSASDVEADENKFVLLNGKCVRIGEQCSPKDENFVVAFRNLDILASCGPPLSFSAQLAGAHENLGCSRGFRPLPNGRCVPVFTL